MRFELETRYPGPSGNRQEWFGAALQIVRESQIGEVPITVELTGGRGSVIGLLTAVQDYPDRDQRAYVAELAVADDVSTVPCRDIAAFILNDGDRPTGAD